MRYLGGKTRNSKPISQLMKMIRTTDQLYIEPFCGAFSVAEKMEGDIWLNDFHEGLINLYKAIQDGSFEYPTRNLTVDDYKWYKANSTMDDPMYTAIGFGLSYAGKWWGGYDSYYDTRGKEGETTRALVNTLKKSFSKSHIQKAKFTNMDYMDIDVNNTLIYCDPPYADTTGYKAIGSFDTDKFWDKVRHWSKTNTVYVSEFAAPEDFKEVWSAPYKVQMCKEQKHVVEKLFTIES